MILGFDNFLRVLVLVSEILVAENKFRYQLASPDLQVHYEFVPLEGRSQEGKRD